MDSVSCLRAGREKNTKKKGKRMKKERSIRKGIAEKECYDTKNERKREKEKRNRGVVTKK